MYVLSDRAIDLLVDVLTDVTTVLRTGGLADIGVDDILVEVRVNIFARVMNEVKFAASVSLDMFSC